MTCANHPELPVAAYCQFCGKPLCAECVHRIHGIVSCESCLAARIGLSAETFEGVNVNDNKGGYYREGEGSQYISPGPTHPVGVQPPSASAEPWIAFGLGFLPGVGAMYNGQFAKGLAHVAIFAVLVDLSNYNGLIGLLIAAWIIYQAFDAYHTALARRDGLPLPNSLGLNDIGQWFGARSIRSGSSSKPWIHPAQQAGSVSAAAAPVEGNGSEAIHEPPGFHPVPPAAMPFQARCGLWRSCGSPGIPTGAVVLVILGVAILLGNLGIFNMQWVEHGWPILLIGLGVFLIIRHTQTPPSGGVR